MSDIAIWRCAENYVVRINGCEVLMSHEELSELQDFIFKALRFGECLSSRGYLEIEAFHKAKEAKIDDILAMLNLKSEPLVRRL